MILYSRKKLYSWATTDSDFDPEKIDMQIGKVGEFIQISYEISHNYVEKVKELIQKKKFRIHILKKNFTLGRLQILTPTLGVDIRNQRFPIVI